MTEPKKLFEKAVIALMSNTNCFRLTSTMSAEEKQRQRTAILQEACIMVRQVMDFSHDSKFHDYLHPEDVKEREYLSKW